MVLFIHVCSCILLKQFNNLITVDTFGWLGGLEVTHLTAVPEVPGSFSRS